MPNDPIYLEGGGPIQHAWLIFRPFATPLTEDTYTGRIDHDFSEKWHFMASYRSMREVNLTTNQVDIGGVLARRLAGAAGGSSAARPGSVFWVVRADHCALAHSDKRFCF